MTLAERRDHVFTSKSVRLHVRCLLPQQMRTSEEKRVKTAQQAFRWVIYHSGQPIRRSYEVCTAYN